MKKIVALVLSLVMALSLCTVAFAAETEYTLFTKDGEDRYTVDTGVKVVLVKADYEEDAEYGWIAHYQSADKANVYAVVDADDAVLSIKVGDATVYLKNVTKAPWGEIYYNYTAKAVDKVYKWDCETGVHEAGYIDENDKLWVESKDAGTNWLLVKDEFVWVKAMEEVKEGTHVLTKVGTTSNKQVNEYKCVVCGKNFYGTMDPAVASDASKDYFAYNGLAVIDAVKGYVTAPEHTEFVKDNLYIWAVDGEKAETAEGVSSAKTFDAGVAMYVGMSLLSVAGGAVVIGKKKEF